MKPENFHDRNPQENGNFLTRHYIFWIWKIFKIGFSKNLNPEDLFQPYSKHRSCYLGNKLEAHWNDEIKRSIEKKQKPKLLRVIIKCFGYEVLLSSIFVFFFEIILRPFQAYLMILFLQELGKDVQTNRIVYVAIGFHVCIFLNIIYFHSVLETLRCTGMKLYIAACTLIYRKTLRLNQTFTHTSVGQIVNLISNDVSQFNTLFSYINYLWVGPVGSVVIGYLAYQYMGIGAIVGTVYLFLSIPLQVSLAKLSTKFHLQASSFTDERLRWMNEIIKAIQVIKMYAWEVPFAKCVATSRANEMNKIKKNYIIKTIIWSLQLLNTNLVVFITVIIFVSFGGQISAENVFAIFSLFSIQLDWVLKHYHSAVSNLSKNFASLQRVERFLVKEEISCDPQNVIGTGSVLRLEKVSAKWNVNESFDILNNINFEMKSGQLIAVLGPVGCGKSTLLQLILKELSPTTGFVERNGSVSYAVQDPWIFPGTIIENILFGLAMNLDRYQKVIEMCCLETDIETFPYKDKTLVGERGAFLSGGQKARLNLARAIYKNSDIYLFDDPLSAVDVHVAKKIFNNCIIDFLRHKTRILVTHQLNHLDTIKTILLINNGTVEVVDNDKNVCNLIEKVVQEQKLVVKDENNTENPNNIEEEESRETGHIDFNVFKIYLKNGGSYFFIFLMALLFVLTQITVSGSITFLAHWINLQKDTDENIVLKFSVLNIYSLFTAGSVLFTVLRSLLLFRFCIRTSNALHNKMFNQIIGAPMNFFYKNLSGRVLNRFSNDIANLDEVLPFDLSDCLQIILQTLSIILITVTVNIWLLLPTFLIGIFLYFVIVIYMKTCFSLMRLEAVGRSPIYSHINSTLEGLSTIRSFQAENMQIKEFERRLDLHTEAHYLQFSGSRFFSFVMDILCAIYIGLVGFSFLLFRGDIPLGSVGLTISQCASLANILQWGVRKTIDVNSDMVFVERIVQYMNIEPEESQTLSTINDSLKESKNLLFKSGKIVFDSVSLRYALDQEPVFKELSFTIFPGEKIGIVGRTGAGKSSLLSALFRLSFLEGEIFIDDNDIKKMKLENLRSQISIIPQQPTILSGTLRQNLDPFEIYSDSELWDALEQVELKSVFAKQVEKLNSPLLEQGKNLSIGQRQLLCLARAILKKNKILVLDEATANVDLETDKIIQKTIKEKFLSSTVLTIAHRLDTIIDSDRIMVVNNGTIVEFNHPYELLQNENGYFYNLLKQTGRSTFDKLLNDTINNYKNCSI